MKHWLVNLLLMFSIPVCAQAPWAGLLSPSRASDWRGVGATIPTGDIPDCAVQPETPVTIATINAAIAANYGGASYCKINIPAGTYTASNVNTLSHHGGDFVNGMINITPPLDPATGFIKTNPTGNAGVANIVLNGAGPNQTFFVWSGSNTGADRCSWGPSYHVDLCIYNGINQANGGVASYGDMAYGAYQGNITAITGGSSSGSPLTQGSTQITLASLTDPNNPTPSTLMQGQIIQIEQLDPVTDNGNAWFCQTVDSSTNHHPCSQQGDSHSPIPPQGQSTETQLFVVAACGAAGNGQPCTSKTITLNTPIRAANWSLSQSPQAAWQSAMPISNVGIQNISIDTTAASDQPIMVSCGQCSNVWFSNVRSISGTVGGQAATNHYVLMSSDHVTVQNSYMYGSNPAASGYGIDFLWGTSDSLAINNISQHIAAGLINETSVGNVFAYNYSVDDFFGGNWQSCSEHEHGAGDSELLYEGNIGICHSADDIHGNHAWNTLYRNYMSGFDPSTATGGKSLNTFAFFGMYGSRYYNLVGNVLGTAGTTSHYENAGQSEVDSSGNVIGCGSGYPEFAVYSLNFSDQNQTLYAQPCYSTPSSLTVIDNDPLVKSSLVRWGNYDVVNGTVQENASETASTAPVYPGVASPATTFPASFFLNAKPSWWNFPNGAAAPWPAIGPDVAGGNIAGTAGHAWLNPAANCYLNVMGGKVDGSSGPMRFDSNNCYVPTSSTPAPAPTFSVASGTYTSAQTVSILDSNPAATIYYTTDGSQPTINSSVYSSPIEVGVSETLNAMAVVMGLTPATASASYTINLPSPAATPSFTPAGGNYASAQTVILSDSTPGATIYYTTDGSQPTTSSSVYLSPVTVAASETLNAIATAPNSLASSVGTAAYAIGVQAPWAGILDPKRAIDWTPAGVQGTAPGVLPSASWTQCGSTIPAGSSASTINNAIQNCGDDQYVQLGAGDFNGLSGITFGKKNNIALRGMGPDQTRLHFTSGMSCGGPGSLICANGFQLSGIYAAAGHNTPCSWISGYEQGSTQVTIDPACPVKMPNVGDVIVLNQCDTGYFGNTTTGIDYTYDSNGNVNGTTTVTVPCPSNGQDTTYGYAMLNNTLSVDNGNYFNCEMKGGMSGFGDPTYGCAKEGTDGNGTQKRFESENHIVTAVNGNTITLAEPIINVNFVTGQSPEAWWHPVLNHIGVENLYIDDASVTGYTYDVFMISTVNSWVYGVEAYNPVGASVAFQQGSHHELANSYFFENRYPDDQATQTTLSSFDLFINNIYQHHQDAVLFEGANPGTVIAYNWHVGSCNFLLPGNVCSSDSQNEGYRSHSNGNNFVLYEGNGGPGYMDDDDHGTGLSNTVYRNFFTGWEPCGTSNGALFPNGPCGNYAPNGIPSTFRAWGTNAISLPVYARYNNIIANVLGTPGYHTGLFDNVSAQVYPNTNVYLMGAGVGSGGAVDALVQSTTAMWGNWDPVTKDVRFNPSETASSAPLYPGLASPSTIFPASFFLTGRPAWWPSSVAYPAIGPDVANGDIGQVSGPLNAAGSYSGAPALMSTSWAGNAVQQAWGGHANFNPAGLCFVNSGGSPDGTGPAIAFSPGACYGTSHLTQVPEPTFNPEGGNFNSSVDVILSEPLPGATVYYSINGGAPVMYNGSPVTMANSGTLTAYATATGLTQSATQSASFSIQGPTATPTFSPNGGSFATAVSVSINDATSGATISYTFTPTVGQPSSGTLSPGSSITISTSGVLSATATASGHNPSQAATASFAIGAPLTSGTYVITNVNSGLNLDAPNASAGTLIDQAAGTGTNQQWKVTSLGNGVFNLNPVVNTALCLDVFSNATGDGSQIGQWTCNGQTNEQFTIAPIQGTTYSIIDVHSGKNVEIPNSSTTAGTVITIHSATGGSNQQWTFQLAGQTPATPTFNPAGGSYTSAQSVSISSTSGATIYYTTDGSTPTTSSSVYNASTPILVSASETLKAIAVASGSQSAVGSAAYTINIPVGVGYLSGTVIAGPAAEGAVNLSNGTTGWTFFNGNVTDASGTAQVSNFKIIGGTAPAYGDDTRAFSWTGGTPTATSSGNTGGIYMGGTSNGFTFSVPASTTPQTVNIYVGGQNSAGTLTATLSDGSVPAYTDTSVNVSAIGYPGWKNFDGVYTLTYAAGSANQTLNITWLQNDNNGTLHIQAVSIMPATLQAATPTFTPGTGTYTAVQNVIIGDTTPGATIDYTTDGSTPTTALTGCPAPCSVTVAASETLNAIATAAGYTTSTAGSAAYVINLPPAPTPTFTPAAGTYTSMQSVTIGSISGATIYYTTDGSTPTTNSSVYNSAISVSGSETLKAIAIAPGYSPSAVGSAAYVIHLSTGISLVQHQVVLSDQTCNPTCPAMTTQPTGAGNLLVAIIQSAGDGSASGNFHIASVACADSQGHSLSCGTWVMPGAACQVYDPYTLGADCAYVLSSGAGATSVTITMTGNSTRNALYFREYHTTSQNGFSFDGGATALYDVNHKCTSCVTPNVAISGANDVLLAGGSPGDGFNGISAPYGHVDSGAEGTILGDVLNTPSGAGATLLQRNSERAAVFTLAFTDSLVVTTPTIAWSNPSSIPYGAALSATQLNASSMVAGTYAYTPAADTMLAAGQHTLSVTFSPTDSVHYTTVTKTVTLQVNPAVLTVTANNANRAMGTANPALSVNYSGFVNGDTASALTGSPALSTSASTSSPAGAYPITVAQGTLNSTNYTFNFVNGTLSVVSAPSVTIAMTATLTGSNKAGYTAAVTIRNTGTALASNVQLTTAALGSAAGKTLPISVGTLAPGAAATVPVAFAGSAGSDGATVLEKLTGTYTGGSFTASIRAQLP